MTAKITVNGVTMNEGLKEVIEAKLRDAELADPNVAPFPMDHSEASAWHAGRASSRWGGSA